MYKAKEGNDVVIASRYIEGGGTDNKKLLIFMSLVVNIMYSKVLNIECKDIPNSFKLYRSQSLKEISLSIENFDIVEEMLVKLKRKNRHLKICEIPYYFKKRMFGHTKRNLFAFFFSYTMTLVKLRLMK